MRAQQRGAHLVWLVGTVAASVFVLVPLAIRLTLFHRVPSLHGQDGAPDIAVVQKVRSLCTVGGSVLPACVFSCLAFSLSEQ